MAKASLILLEIFLGIGSSETEMTRMLPKPFDNIFVMDLKLQMWAYNQVAQFCARNWGTPNERWARWVSERKWQEVEQNPALLTLITAYQGDVEAMIEALQNSKNLSDADLDYWVSNDQNGEDLMDYMEGRIGRAEMESRHGELGKRYCEVFWSIQVSWPEKFLKKALKKCPFGEFTKKREG